MQVYSCTNRILNPVKTYGNIVCFRDLEDATNNALELFGNKNAGGIVLLKPYKDYLTDYAAKVKELLARFPLGQPIVGEEANKEFVKLFGTIVRLENILTSFDEFSADDMRLFPDEGVAHVARRAGASVAG
ncbi:type I restriction endonuclease subunit R, EcoR124 family [Cutibacterium avidum]|uniref:type I restriction endonuclease subunit R, EcoR124 family n=1 Tax=Cutibacterium avidum TaxID=33010 RepID=UPI003B008DB3